MNVVLTAEQPFTHLTFSSTCIDCGGPLRLVNRARPTSRESIAIVRCDPCGIEVDVLVRVAGIRRDPRHCGRRAEPLSLVGVA